MAAPIKFSKVISGGQTGADIAGLIAAKECKIPTGGTAPSGYKTENGPNVDLQKKFFLKAEGTYKSRTKKNVDDSDGTLCLVVHKGSGGTSKTAGYAINHTWSNPKEFVTNNDGYKPVMVLHLLEEGGEENVAEIAQKIVDWVIEMRIEVLNIAGHRQTTAFDPNFYKAPPPFNYQKFCCQVLKLAFTKLKEQKSQKSQNKIN